MHDSEPASVQSKRQSKDLGSLFLNFRQVQTQRCPMGLSSTSWFFFFLPYLSYFECKRRNQRQTLSQKKGEKCAYLPSSSVIHQSMLCSSPRSPHLPFAFLTSIYILFITYSTPEPQSLGSGQNKCACSEIFICQAGQGYLSCRDSFQGYFWRLGKIVCFPLKPICSGAESI